MTSDMTPNQMFVMQMINDAKHKALKLLIMDLYDQLKLTPPGGSVGAFFDTAYHKSIEQRFRDLETDDKALAAKLLAEYDAAVDLASEIRSEECE